MQLVLQLSPVREEEHGSVNFVGRHGFAEGGLHGDIDGNWLAAVIGPGGNLAAPQVVNVSAAMA